MKTDLYGQIIYNEDDLCDSIMCDLEKGISKSFIDKKINFDNELELTNIPDLVVYEYPNVSIEDFDSNLQNRWLMPDNYKHFDIAKWVLSKCETDEELQRVGHELLLYSERGLLTFLNYMKYLVDTMKEHNIVWGVGRGSSVSSFVLYLIGVHRINSLYFDLSIEEFLK